MELLLLSTGGSPYLEHALPELHWFLQGRTTVGFVTAALEWDKDIPDEATYFANVRRAFERIHVTARHIRWDEPSTHDLPAHGIQAIVVGGGNTYLLLQRLHAFGLYRAIEMAVRDGTPYIGASAGSNIAGWNIGGTNDWNSLSWRGIEVPLDQGGPFRGFHFVPWIINSHFVSGKIPGAPQGEAREERIKGLQRWQHRSVLGLPERTMIHAAGNDARVLSATGQSAYLFEPDRDVITCAPGTSVPRLIL